METIFIFLAILAVALLIVDWRQTLTIAKNPEKFFERNFPHGIAEIIGKHPKARDVHTWFSICICATVMGSYFLPNEIAIVGLIILILVELKATIGNFKIGIKP